MASGNPGKVTEIREILMDLSIELVGLEALPEVVFPAEGRDYASNASAKATAVASQLGEPAIADDSGLEVDALQGAPGPLSARYGSPEFDDRGRLRKLLDALAAIPPERRQARFVCAAALALPDEEAIVVWGECKGTILSQPRGEQGFGYDPVFQPEGLNKSLAELSTGEKNELSHRGRAFRLLRGELQRLLLDAE